MAPLSSNFKPKTCQERPGLIGVAKASAQKLSQTPGNLIKQEITNSRPACVPGKRNEMQVLM